MFIQAKTSVLASAPFHEGNNPQKRFTLQCYTTWIRQCCSRKSFPCWQIHLLWLTFVTFQTSPNPRYDIRRDVFCTIISNSLLLFNKPFTNIIRDRAAQFSERYIARTRATSFIRDRRNFRTVRLSTYPNLHFWIIS